MHVAIPLSYSLRPLVQRILTYDLSLTLNATETSSSRKILMCNIGGMLAVLKVRQPSRYILPPPTAKDPPCNISSFTMSDTSKGKLY